MRKKSRRRGFSLIEVMISGAVLSIGLLGVVELHRSSVRGLARGRAITVAGQIVAQRAEQLAGPAPDALTLPACPRAGGVLGCRLSSSAFATSKTCTAWLLDSDVPSATGVDVPSTPDVGYRRDVVIEAHPDTTNHQGSFLATISVCWLDTQGKVQELQAQKLLVPGA
jgi:prepilin-type N-terminal cleavage/methylation domain-containing protein